MLGCLSPMTVRAPYFAFVYLLPDPTPSITRHHFADAGGLGAGVEVVELEHGGVRLPAVDAWVGEKVRPQLAAVYREALPLLRHDAVDIALLVLSVVTFVISALARPAVDVVLVTRFDEIEAGKRFGFAAMETLFVLHGGTMS